ncbi:hypothetical protein SUGI_0766090 [Cryptomeria japonica]|nr:hypothetical protein SUGI_0766090 [Cryptomeria japonica]
MDIQLSADAFISNDAVQLTDSQSSLGWATYSSIIPSQALASFSTHFQFSITALNGSGDDLTLFFAPSGLQSYGPLSQVQLFLSQNPGSAIPSKPERPVLWYTLDPSQFLPRFVKVGIFASAGIETETHIVYAWSFSYRDSSHALTAPPAPIRKKKHHNFIIISIILVIAITITIILIRWLCRSATGEVGKKTKDKLNRPSLESVDRDGEEEDSDDELDKRLARAIQSARKFSYDELCIASKNFSPEEEIGEGGFGKVYRGSLPGTNQAVAVKRMNLNSNQGQKVYESEVIINGNLTHRNLVEFLGCCHRKGEKLLVYELLPNGSLDKYIFQSPKGPLDWDKRYIIARDVAVGLVYLHLDRRENILHRDIKEDNVMLDSDFRAKLGDFGLARALKSEDEEHWHNSMPYGTFGYVVLEYATERKFSRESNVFSFGALALAIACGKRPVDKALMLESNLTHPIHMLRMHKCLQN